MKVFGFALVVVGLGGAAVAPASAQALQGFGSFSVNSDVNGQVFPGASGGVLVDVADSWLSVGAQGDLFVSWPYFAGRGGPLAQVNLVRRWPVRIFAVGGLSWGEQAGPMVGAGMELWTRAGFGLRVSAQDYLVRIQGFDCAAFGYGQAYCDAHLHGGRTYTGHQPTFQVGIIWR